MTGVNLTPVCDDCRKKKKGCPHRVPILQSSSISNNKPARQQPPNLEREIDHTYRKKVIAREAAKAEAASQAKMGRKKSTPQRVEPPREEYGNADDRTILARVPKADFMGDRTEPGKGNVYLNPVYTTFMDKHAPGLSPVNPMMDAEKLSSAELVPLLFEIIPGPVHKEKEEYDAPWAPEGGVNPIEYRRPENLVYYIEPDPTAAKLEVIMIRIEKALDKMWSGVEAVVAAYDSEPGEQSKEIITKFAAKYMQHHKALNKELRELADHEETYTRQQEREADKTGETLAERVPRSGEEEDPYDQLFNLKNGTWKKGERSEIVEPQLLYGTEVYLRALAAAVKTAYKTLEIISTPAIPSGSWLPARGNAFFGDQYTKHSLPGLRVLRKVIQIRDWECPPDEIDEANARAEDEDNAAAYGEEYEEEYEEEHEEDYEGSDA